MKKYRKSDWQRVKERFGFPYSVKTLMDFWKKLSRIPNVYTPTEMEDRIEQFELRHE